MLDYFFNIICTSSLPSDCLPLKLYCFVLLLKFFFFEQRNLTLYLIFIHHEALVWIIYGAVKTEIAQGLALSKAVPILPLTMGGHTVFMETVLTFFLRSVFSDSITCTSVHSLLSRLICQLSLIDPKHTKDAVQ